MYFLFINKTLRLKNLKTRTAVNAKISVFVNCVEAIIYLLLYGLHYDTFKSFVNLWGNFIQRFLNYIPKVPFYLCGSNRFNSQNINIYYIIAKDCVNNLFLHFTSLIMIKIFDPKHAKQRLKKIVHLENFTPLSYFIFAFKYLQNLWSYKKCQIMKIRKIMWQYIREKLFSQTIMGKIFGKRYKN